MKITRNLGLLLLSIYLIIVGLAGLFDLHLGQASIVMPILALAAGVLILVGR